MIQSARSLVHGIRKAHVASRESWRLRPAAVCRLNRDAPAVLLSVFELRRVHDSHAIVADEHTKTLGEFASGLHAPLFGEHEVGTCK